MNAPRASALDFAGRGWPVLPLHTPASDGGCTCGRECGSPGKHPRTRRGVRDATTDAGVIRAWWDHWPAANVGLATGTVPGIVALDVDNAAADQALLELAAGRELGGLVVRTGRGEQRWYSTPADVSIGNRSRLYGIAGLDVRGLGGYVISPPSAHVLGRRYAFASGSLEPMPGWLLEALLTRSSQAPALDARSSVRRSPANPVARSHAGEAAPWESVPLERELAYGRGVLARRCAAVRAEPEGGRNSALVRAATTVAGYVASGALDGEVAREELLSAALDAGLGELEARRTIRSGFQRGQTRPLHPPAGEAA